MSKLDADEFAIYDFSEFTEADFTQIDSETKKHFPEKASRTAKKRRGTVFIKRVTSSLTYFSNHQPPLLALMQ